MAGFPEAARRAAAHVVVDDLESPVLDEDDRKHLASSLRLRDGEAVSVTDGLGGWRLCSYETGGLRAADEVCRFERPSPLLCVGFAPVKGDRPEWVVQKLTELGVDRIVVMHTERSVVRWDGERAASHLRRLGSVARQAVMQSRGLWLPAVEGVAGFDSLVSAPAVALAEPGGGPLTLASTTVLIGPEGGWSERELSSVRGRTVSLGEGVLRAETAAVAAGVLLTALRAGLVSPA